MTQIKVIFLIILMVLITAIIAVKRPVMHKQVLIEDINFSFVAEAPQVQNSEKNTEQKSQVSNSNDKDENNSVVSQNKPNNIRENIIARFDNQNNTEPKNFIQNKNNIAPKPQDQQKTQTKQTIASNNQANQVIQHPEPVIIKKEVVDVPKQLTEAEEIIAWNKWRSDLQNQVMRDAKIGAPLGTVFKFSFTVDKFGTISNLKVWSTDPMFTNLGIRVIRPIIVKYQGQPILNFPEGTKRIITNVTGGFVMSTQTGYSNPSDYSDYETVKK